MAGLIPIGAITAAGDITTADLVRGTTRTGRAVDERMAIQVGPLVSQAMADDPTIADAAVDAVADAALQDEAFRSSFLTRKIRAVTLVKNGTFQSTADWAVYTGGTGLAAANSTISVTGTGSASGVGIASGASNRPLGVAGHELYVRARIRTRAAGAASIMVRTHSSGTFAYLNGTTVAVSNPTQDVWYDVTGKIIVPSAHDGALMELQILVVYPTQAESNGATTEIARLTVVDLTDDFGAGAEPSTAEFTNMVDDAGGVISTYADVTDRPLVSQVAGLSGDIDAPALAAQLGPYLGAATTTVPSGVTMALVGDSQTWRVGPKIRASDGGFALKGAHFPSIGWLNWANAALGGALSIVSNLAQSGKRADEVLAEQIPVILDLDPAPAWVACYVGINDVVQGRSAAQIIADLDEAFTGLRAAGIAVVTGTLMATGSLTTPQRAVLFTVNAWLKGQAQTRDGFVLVDWFAHMADAAGVAVPALYVDGLHPTPAGAARMGAVAASALDGLIPRVDVLPLPGDPANVSPNPSKTGTSGTAGAGVTGQVASSWTAATTEGTVVASVEARDDGIAGSWQKLTLTGATTELSAVSVSASSGQTWQAVAEIDVDDPAGLTRVALHVEVAGTGQVLTCLGPDPDVDSAEGAVIDAMPARMVLRTPKLQLDPGATGLVLRVHVNGTGTVRIGRTGLNQGA